MHIGDTASSKPPGAAGKVNEMDDYKIVKSVLIDVADVFYEDKRISSALPAFDRLAAEVERLTAELADARAQLDAATKLNTDLLNDAIRLMGRVNELEEAGEVWRPAPPQE